MRLDASIRRLFGKLVNKGLTVTRISELFDTTRQTVHRWLKRAKHVGREYFKDKPREPKPGKITDEVELSILALRNTFKWGTARIQQGLLRLPGFVTEAVRCVQGIRLSSESINNILTRHGLNGYLHECKRWRFFRAREPDELWQLDFKDPFTMQVVKYWFLVVIDDYSWFLVVVKQCDYDPTTVEVASVLGRLRRGSRQILSDHGKQFMDGWVRWCRRNGVEALYAHPSYT